MKGIRLLLLNLAPLLCIPFSASGAETEITVKPGSFQTIADGLAVRCDSSDLRNFEGYAAQKGAKPYVVAIALRFAPDEGVLIRLSEDESSYMELLAGGASYAPRAVGSDVAPPPPPGRAPSPTDRWSLVSKLATHRDGGRFLMAESVGTRDYLFEIPASAAPEAVRMQVVSKKGAFYVRCEPAPRTPARLTYVQPVFPEVAKQAGIVGDVILELEIDSRGVVSSVKIVKNIPLLGDAAAAAARQWVYEPARQGEESPRIVTVTESFRIKTTPARKR